MADKGLMYMVQSVGPRTVPCGTPECTGAKAEIFLIKRRSVYDHSDKMKTIEGQHQ